MKTDQIDNLARWQCRAIPTPRAWFRPAAVSIECLSGCLWVTLDRDPQDHILQAGQRARFCGTGLVVTSVAQASTYRLTGPARQQRFDVLHDILAPA